MIYKVWRRTTDQSVVGFCDADYSGFRPGGDNLLYDVTLESSVPVIAVVEKQVNPRVAAVEKDGTISQPVKTLLLELASKLL